MGVLFAPRPPAVPEVVESGALPMQSRSSTGQSSRMSKGGGGRRSAPGGRPPPALNIMSL